MRVPIFNAMDLEGVRLEVEMVEVNQAGLGSTERVVVDQIKEEAVTQLCLRDRAKESSDLAHGEVLNLGSPRLGCTHSIDPPARCGRSDLHAFLHFREVESGRKVGRSHSAPTVWVRTALLR